MIPTALFCFFIFVGFISGFLIGSVLEINRTHKLQLEAIDRGFAYYHPKTREFAWSGSRDEVEYRRSGKGQEPPYPPPPPPNREVKGL